MKNYRRIDRCRCCKSFKVQYLFSLGDQWLTDFPDPGHEKEGILCPLNLMMCRECGFVQLEHTVEKDSIYGRETYWYKSGVNSTMREALKDVVDKAMSLVSLKEGDLVIDIGSNDGTLVSFYPKGTKIVGFEPSKNVWKESVNKVKWEHGYNDFFTFRGHIAKIITSCAMFYDLDDPDKFLEDIKLSLALDGIWVDQQNYLAKMIENQVFDNISHEHLGYYSFQVFENLLKKHGLEIFDVEVNGINGGSFRSYIRHAGSSVMSTEGAADRIAAIRVQEENLKLDDPETYANLYKVSCDVQEKLSAFIHSIKKEGKTVYVYGASTRGQVILQFCGLDNSLIDGCAERNPDKYGKVTIGTGIPIYDEEYVRTQNPDYMLVLPYAFIDEFVERENIYLQSGGIFIVPLPRVKLIGKSSAGEVWSRFI